MSHCRLQQTRMESRSLWLHRLKIRAISRFFHKLSWQREWYSWASGPKCTTIQFIHKKNFLLWRRRSGNYEFKWNNVIHNIHVLTRQASWTALVNMFFQLGNLSCFLCEFKPVNIEFNLYIDISLLAGIYISSDDIHVYSFFNTY